jgi:hypothetical protein
VPDAERVAAACVLVRVDATVVPLGSAGVAVVPADVDAAEGDVQRLSRALGQAELVLLQRREDRVEGSRWQAGTREDLRAPGAALAGLPGEAERLVLGTPASEIDGHISTRGMSRVAAARTAMAGTPAEAAWVAKADRWSRALRVALLVLLVVVAAWQLLLAGRGEGSWVVLGVSLALLGLIGAQRLRRRGSP